MDIHKEYSSNHNSQSRLSGEVGKFNDTAKVVVMFCLWDRRSPPSNRGDRI